MKTIDFSVIDQMYSAILAANENDAHPDSESIKHGFTVAFIA